MHRHLCAPPQSLTIQSGWTVRVDTNIETDIRPRGNALPLRRSSIAGKRRSDEGQSLCGLSGVNKPGSDPPLKSGKKDKEKATKMLGIFVLMLGVSHSPNSVMARLVAFGPNSLNPKFNPVSKVTTLLLFRCCVPQLTQSSFNLYSCGSQIHEDSPLP